MFLILAALSFAVFVGNVFYGSVSGSTPLGNVGELLLLIFSTICFVVAILRAEERRGLENFDSKNTNWEEST